LAYRHYNCLIPDKSTFFLWSTIIKKYQIQILHRNISARKAQRKNKNTFIIYSEQMQSIELRTWLVQSLLRSNNLDPSELAGSPRQCRYAWFSAETLPMSQNPVNHNILNYLAINPYLGYQCESKLNQLIVFFTDRAGAHSKAIVHNKSMIKMYV